MSTKRKTRASESAVETPETKRRKATDSDDAEKTQVLGYELLDQLKAARDKRNRLITIEFASLPDVEEVPDYYDIIKLPVALETVEEKLKNLEYPTMTTLESDFKRMVENAKTYNEKDSEIYADAERIRKNVHAFMTKNNPAYNNPDYTSFPTPIPSVKERLGSDAKQSGRKTRGKAPQDLNKEDTVEDSSKDADDPETTNAKNQAKRRLTLNGPRGTNPITHDASAAAASAAASPQPPKSPTSFKGMTFQKAQEVLVDDLLDFTNEEGVEISGPFLNLPPRDLRDYYQAIKYPVSLRGIQKKVRGQKGREKASGQSLFASWQEIEEEFEYIWKNARLYNEEGSEIYDAAGELEKHFRKRLKQAKSNVQEPAQPKVTLRVGAKETEAPTKLKLHLSKAPKGTDGYTVDSEALQRQQDLVSAGTGDEARAKSRSAEERAPTEPINAKTPEAQANGIKAETIVSQSPPAPSGVRPASSASGENAASARNESAPPISATAREGSPVESLPRAPPPPPPRDPLEARLRTSGNGVADALITSFVLSSHPSLNEESPFQLTVPPSEQLSQQSVTASLSESQRLLRLATTFTPSLFQRPYRIVMRLNKEYLQPVQTRTDDPDPRSRTYDANLIPGMVNTLDLEVLVSLTPRGAPKVGNSSEYDYERTTVYFNVFG